MKPKRAVYAGRLRLRLVANRSTKTLTGFVQENVAKGAVVRTDGWQGYDELAALGYSHEPMVLDGDPERTDAHLPMIHIAFSNLKTWLLGTHHGVSHQHLQAYLNEFVFRFNRRFYPMTAFNSVLGLASHASAPTYKTLYSGEWTHPHSMIGNQPDRQGLFDVAPSRVEHDLEQWKPVGRWLVRQAKAAYRAA